MSIEFPDFRNNTVEFLEKVGNLVKERLQSHSQKYAELCDELIKSYWYTYQIPEIIRHALAEDVELDRMRFDEVFSEYTGIWNRYVESLNLLRDSLILGLQGRAIPATTILRSALESIVTGVFFNHLAQVKYRESASKLTEETINRVEGIVAEIGDEHRSPSELEYRFINQAISEDLHIPRLEGMLRQIEEWDILSADDKKLEDVIKDGLWSQLSEYSHSLLHTCYIGRDLINSPSLDQIADEHTVQAYTGQFRATCMVILLLFLGSTIELQKSKAFSNSMTKFLDDNPEMNTILLSIPQQIREQIKN